MRGLAFLVRVEEPRSQRSPCLTRFSVFKGRRILRLYLSIFFHAHASLLQQSGQQQTQRKASTSSASIPRLPSTKLCESLLDQTLNTYSLGKYVASRWELEDNMRWMQLVCLLTVRRRSPADTFLQVDQRGRPSGFGKVSGQVVEAIMGGIFRQYVGLFVVTVCNDCLRTLRVRPWHYKSSTRACFRS
jgi:hypothetical protein